MATDSSRNVKICQNTISKLYYYNGPWNFEDIVLKKAFRLSIFKENLMETGTLFFNSAFPGLT